MDDVDKLLTPEDLQNALAKKSGATEFFREINDSSKRFVLWWIKLAKTEKIRKARIEQIAELSAKGEKLQGADLNSTNTRLVTNIYSCSSVYPWHEKFKSSEMPGLHLAIMIAYKI